MYMSEYKIIHENKNLIICFGGMSLQFGGILPFEFLRYFIYPLFVPIVVI